VTVWRDDLGHLVELTGPARRVLSLVPSLTEAVAVSAPGQLVGATDWCTQPAGLAVTRVRGTKNPERAAIIALAPAGTGTYKVLRGSGAYAGITGHGTYRLSIVQIAARVSGTCSQTAPLVASQELLQLSGPVHL
jgi:hypothetical protein